MKLIKRQIFSNDLATGMRLGENIFDHEGKILLAEGTLLKSNMINRIQNINLEKILIFFECEEIDHEDSTSNFSNEYSEEDIQRTIFETKSIMNESLKKFKFNEMVEFDKILDIVDQLIEEILLNDFVTISLLKIKGFDNYLLDHSVNVCLLSIVTGIYLNYDRDELVKLGLGALLHDVGKTMVKNDVLNKPSKLTSDEFDIMKTHTTLGYNLVKNSDHVPCESMNVILYHHERVDGKGYPEGIFDLEINDFAKIVSVADVFDAITSDRVYRDKIDPYTAVEYIIGETDKKFDRNIVCVFLKLIGYYPIGLRVTLNSGEQGIVKKKNMKKPIIRILLDENTKPVQGYYEIDLNRNPSVAINDFKLKGDFNSK